MLKKVFGGFLLAIAALELLSVINSLSVMSRLGLPVTYNGYFWGYFLGQMLPVIVNFSAAVFLFRFDRAYYQRYEDGFITRRKQCSKFVCFIAFYGILYIMALLGGRFSFKAVMLSILMYALPAVVFSAMMGYYALPFWACKKNFHINDESFRLYLSAKNLSYYENNFVIASDTILFFPKTFCIVPIDRIASTRFKVIIGIEKNVVFTLDNGKMITLLANEKQYNSVLAAIAANKH